MSSKDALGCHEWCSWSVGCSVEIQWGRDWTFRQSPTLIMWPTCTPHGVTVTGATPRITFTVPLCLTRQEGRQSNHRGLRHLQLVAQWKAATTDEERTKLLEHIRDDKIPWAYGPVHKKPGDTEASIIEFFHELAVSPEEVQSYCSNFSRAQD